MRTRLSSGGTIRGFFFVAMALAIAAMLFAQQPDETLPGFKPNGTFDSHGIDNVNIFSGDPGAVIPIGPVYTLGPTFQWQLKAYYSSKFWHLDTVCGTPYQHARITGYPALGAGWTLDLGHINSGGYPPGTDGAYQSPDGQAHLFKLTSNVGITYDGSDLRITNTTPSCTPSSGNCQYTVEFPDGSIQYFTHNYLPPVTVSGTSHDFTFSNFGTTNPAYHVGLTSIQDGFGTTLLQVNYDSTNHWQVNSIDLDPGVTGHPTITYQWINVTIPTNVQWRVLDYIQLPSATGTLQVNFDFITNRTVQRNAYDSVYTCESSGTCTVGCWLDDPTASVPLLNDIQMTDTGGSFTAFQYTFGYITEVDSQHIEDGLLTTITLPTNGTITYNYSQTSVDSLHQDWDPENWGFVGSPLEDSPNSLEDAPYFQDIPGVNKRIETFNGQTSETDYDRVVYQQYCPGCPPNYFDTDHVTAVVCVTRPTGNTTTPKRTTKHLFHYAVFIGANPPVQSTGMELEERDYQDTHIDIAHPPVRTKVYCHEADDSAATCGVNDTSGNGLSYGFHNNIRLQKTVNWFGVSPAGGGDCSQFARGCIQSTNGNYNSTAFKYALNTISNSNLTSGGPTRNSNTNWSPSTASWLLNLFDKKFVWDGTTQPSGSNGSTIVRSYADFDSTTGFLKGLWTWNSTASTAREDCRYNPNLDGTIQSQFSKTVTAASEPTSDPCPTSIPSVGTDNDAFGKSFPLWQNGQLRKSNWIKASSSIGWNSFDVDRDTDTGLITTSRASDGLSTSYTYDALGRLKTVTPPGESTTTVSYDTTQQTTVTRGSGSTGTWQRYLYDDLGRLSREIRQITSSSYAVRVHSYDTAGHEYFTSEWTTCSSPSNCGTVSVSSGTTLSGFDPFDRAGTVKKADNHTTTIVRTDGSMSYSDTLEAATIDNVGGVAATTTTRKDSLGRVVSVTDALNNATTYGFNVQDKLTTVTQGSQGRTFGYSAFGFLSSEQTPEDGTTGNATANYTSYGSLGNLRTKTDGSPASTTYTYTYDAAGRLATLTTGSGASYLENCYDGSTISPTCPDGGTLNYSGGTYPGGKLTRRFGSNPLFKPYFPVAATPEVIEEDLDYSSAVGGRLSSKGTRLTSWTSLYRVLESSISPNVESWTYNNLGLLATHGHPRVAIGTPPLPVANLTETLTYTYGLPTTISAGGLAFDNSTIPTATITASYASAGALSSYTGSQGSTTLTTTITPDGSGIARPARIFSTPSGFDSGTYSYDGAGDITAMGTDSFKYDKLARITSAKYSGQTTPCTDGTSTSQCFSYDSFGNLTGVTGNDSRSLGTSTSTNHLSSGAYDSRGNLATFTPDTLSYDELNRHIEDTQSGGVDWQNLFNAADERVARVTVSNGTASVTRRRMARYLDQAKPLALTTSSCAEVGRTFTDVHCADPDWAYIQTIFASGITSGCGGGNYCPELALTRAQMAVFLLVTEHGTGYTPPTCTATIFTDEPCPGGPNVDWVNELYNEGIASGCGGGNFCPNNPITETQMAIYMSTTPLWPNYHPVQLATYTLRDDQNRLTAEDFDTLPSRDNVFLGNILVASYVSNSYSGTLGWQFHSSDHLGSVRLTEYPSTSTETHKYWPFGDEIGLPASPFQRITFAAMERDTEAKHYYDHARTDDFNLGRFSSPDRLGLSSTWNRYAYADNNPVSFVDPDGLETIVYKIGIGFYDFPSELAGHAMLSVKAGTDAGYLSQTRKGGPAFKLGSPSAELAHYRAEGRSITEYHLRTSPPVDTRLYQFISQASFGKWNIFTANCAHTVCTALNAVGLTPYPRGWNGLITPAGLGTILLESAVVDTVITSVSEFSPALGRQFEYTREDSYTHLSGQVMVGDVFRGAGRASDLRDLLTASNIRIDGTSFHLFY